jgi:hypothetical protein
VRQRMQIAETASLAPVNDAVDFLIAISDTARSFAEQDSAKRRDFAAGCTRKADWKRGELRMSFKTPFAEIALSNRERRDDSDDLRGTLSNFNSWRRGGDSNSRYP